MAEQPSNVVLNFTMNGQVQYAQTLQQINMVMQTAAKEYQSHVAAMGRDATMTEKLMAEKRKLDTQMNASTERVRMLREQYEAMANDTNTTAEELQKMYNKLLTAETAHSRLEQSMERVNAGLTDEAVAAREAQTALGELQASGRSLVAEQQQVISAFELEAAQLGANATEAQKLELAQRRLAAQTGLAERAVSNLEGQLEQSRTAYGENSDEVRRLEAQLNDARTTLHRFGDDLDDVEDDSASAGDSLGKLGGAFQALGGIVAGLGLGAIIKSALAEADVASTIDITFNVPEESKEAIRSTLSEVEKYDVDRVAALEGMRRQWVLNKDASDEMNMSVSEGAAALTGMYASLDFVEVVQEVNNISKVLGTTNDEALDLIYNLINVGLPPEQISVIAEFGNQFTRLGYTAKESQGLIASAVATGSSDVTSLLDGLKEGIIKAREFSLGISDAMKESIRAIKGGVEKASEGQLEAMKEGFSKQESALSKSIASRAKVVSKGHDQQKNTLSKVLDNEYKAVSKNYDNQAKALEKSLTNKYDKTSKKLDEEQKMLEKSLSTSYDKVVKNYDEQQKALEKSLDAEMKAFEKASDEKIKLIDKEFLERMKLVDEDRYNQLKALDGQIGALDAMTEAEDKAIKQRENAEKRAELNKRISTAETSEDRMSAMKDLRDFEEKVRLDAIREDRKKQIDAIKTQKEDIKELSDAKKEAIQEEANDLKEAIQEQSGIEKDALKERQDLEKEASKLSIKESLSALSEENKATVEAFKEQNKLKLSAISEANKVEMDAFKETSDAKLEVLKEEHNLRKSSLSERLSDEADAVRESHAAELESFKKMNAEKMEIAKNPPDSAAVQALFDQLEGWGAAVAKGGPEGKQAFEDMVKWFDTIEDAALRNAIGAEIFGSKWEDEGDKLVDALLNSEEAMAEVEKRVGSFGAAADEVGNTTTVKLKEAFAEMMKELAPLLIEVSKVVGAFAKFAADNPKLTATLATIGSAIAVVAGGFAFFAPIVTAILSHLTKLGPIFTAIRTAMMALTGPVGIVIAIVVALGIAIYKNWDEIKEYTIAAFTAIGEFLSSAWESTKEVAIAAFTAIGDFFKEWGATILVILGGPLVWAVALFVKHWDEIKKVTTTIFNAIKDFISKVWESIKLIFTTIISGIVAFVKEKWEALKKNTSDIFNAIKDAISTIWEAIKKVVSSVVDGIKSKVTDTFETLKTTVSIIWDGIKDAITGPIELAREAVRKAIEAIKEFFNFEFKWPELKTPKFDIKGSLNPLDWFGEGVPKFDIKWNAKGGIFKQPTIFGASNGQLQGAGEAGPEAVIPLNAKTLGDIGKGIFDAMNINGGNGGDIIVQQMVVREEADIKKVSRELYNLHEQRRRGRGRGKG